MAKLIEKYCYPKEHWPHLINVPDVPHQLNLSEIYLDEKIKKGKGNKIACLFEDKKLTYGDLYLKTCVLGNALKAIGVKPGDRIAIRLNNIPEYLITMLAALRIGSIYVSVFPLFKAREIAQVVNSSEAKYIVTSVDLIDEIEKALPNMPTVEKVIVVGGTEKEESKGFLSLEKLIDNHKHERELKPTLVDRDEVVFINYTSGTTGLPKGCARTPTDYIGYGEYHAKQHYKINEDDVVGGTATLAFAFGHGLYFAMSFYVGAATSLMVPPFTPERIFRTIQEHGITILGTVPSAYRRLVAARDMAKQFDLSSVRMCISAGELLTANLYEAVKEIFPNAIICQEIGMTEVGAGFIANSPEKNRPGSLGIPVPGFEVKVVDDKGRELPQGKTGNIIFRGFTGPRYWKMPEKQKEVVREGWVWTGDLGYQDTDGFFWYMGRADEMIKVSGYLVSPFEIEDTLREHPAVADVAVAPAPDVMRGWMPKAFVVLKEGHEPTDKLKEELISFVEARISPYKKPREIVFVADLPKTQTGKINRVALRQAEIEKFIKEHPNEAKMLGLV